MNSFGSAAERIAFAGPRVLAVMGRPVDELGDDELMSLMSDATELRNGTDLVLATVAALIDRRSSRDRGVEGLARQNGHRTGASLVQNITGQSKADVARAVSTGYDLLGVAPGAAGETSGSAGETTGAAGETSGAVGETSGAVGETSGAAESAVPVVTEPRWKALLRAALWEGRVTTAQHRAVRDGLGEPPVERYPDTDPALLVAAWARAVELLLEEASEMPVEDLRAAARIARDRLDPVGVSLRFDERYAARSLRRWTDGSGQKHLHLVLDDESAAWVDAMMSAALRPRRGPRFVGADAKPKTVEAAADQRTTPQLEFDTLLAVLRTGAAADPQQAFGDRQPGVRIVVEATATTTDETGRLRVAGVGHLEDGGQALPGAVVEKYLCDAGSLPVTIDPFGRPLDVGREKRLFTRAQRIGIAVREGGCIGPHCSAPPSWTEIHHIDEWAGGGRTDIDDGVPLCRPCHLDLHNRDLRIRRERDPDTGRDTYWLHGPPDRVTGEAPPPARLRTRSPRRFETRSA